MSERVASLLGAACGLHPMRQQVAARASSAESESNANDIGRNSLSPSHLAELLELPLHLSTCQVSTSTPPIQERRSCVSLTWLGNQPVAFVPWGPTGDPELRCPLRAICGRKREQVTNATVLHIGPPTARSTRLLERSGSQPAELDAAPLSVAC